MVTLQPENGLSLVIQDPHEIVFVGILDHAFLIIGRKSTNFLSINVYTETNTEIVIKILAIKSDTKNILGTQ